MSENKSKYDYVNIALSGIGLIITAILSIMQANPSAFCCSFVFPILSAYATKRLHPAANDKIGIALKASAIFGILDTVVFTALVVIARISYPELYALSYAGIACGIAMLLALAMSAKAARP